MFVLGYFASCLTELVKLSVIAFRTETQAWFKNLLFVIGEHPEFFFIISRQCRLCFKYLFFVRFTAKKFFFIK